MHSGWYGMRGDFYEFEKGNKAAYTYPSTHQHGSMHFEEKTKPPQFILETLLTIYYSNVMYLEG